jgi:hypothetical protein
MEHNISINLTYVVAICITLTVVLMFPGVSLELWQLPMKKWKLYNAMRLSKKSKRAEEKLKKYCEIDLTKLR